MSWYRRGIGGWAAVWLAGWLALPGCDLTTHDTTGAGVLVIEQALLKASNTGPGDRFGWSVALSADTLAVGAILESSSGRGVDGEQQDDRAAESGAVYVFRRDGEVWVQEAFLKASNTGPGDRFGWSVALSGDTLAVGAIWEDSDARGAGGHQHNARAIDSGAVYVFRRDGGRWHQEAYLKASNTGAGDLFGYSLALSGDTLAVGAYGEDSGATGTDGTGRDGQHDDSAPDSGAVYVFRRRAGPGGASWAQEAYLKASNTGALDELGRSLALSGDVLAAGAYHEDGGGSPHDDGAPDSGAVYVFRRTHGDTGACWTQEAYLKASNADAGDWFGRSVVLSGDTLAVGALLEDSSGDGSGDGDDGGPHDNGAPDSGAVYVFRRTPGPGTGARWAQEAYLKASNTGAGDRFGMSVALSADTLATGAVFEAGRGAAGDGEGGPHDDGAPDSGAVYLFSRDGTSWTQEAYLKAFHPGAGDRLGYSLALSEGTLAAGAVYEDSGGAGFHRGPDGGRGDDRMPDSGAVYLFQ